MANPKIIAACKAFQAKFEGIQMANAGIGKPKENNYYNKDIPVKNPGDGGGNPNNFEDVAKACYDLCKALENYQLHGISALTPAPLDAALDVLYRKKTLPLIKDERDFELAKSFKEFIDVLISELGFGDKAGFAAKGVSLGNIKKQLDKQCNEYAVSSSAATPMAVPVAVIPPKEKPPTNGDSTLAMAKAFVRQDAKQDAEKLIALRAQLDLDSTELKNAPAFKAVAKKIKKEAEERKGHYDDLSNHLQREADALNSEIDVMRAKSMEINLQLSCLTTFAANIHNNPSVLLNYSAEEREELAKDLKLSPADKAEWDRLAESKDKGIGVGFAIDTAWNALHMVQHRETPLNTLYSKMVAKADARIGDVSKEAAQQVVKIKEKTELHNGLKSNVAEAQDLSKGFVGVIAKADEVVATASTEALITKITELKALIDAQIKRVEKSNRLSRYFQEKSNAFKLTKALNDNLNPQDTKAAAVALVDFINKTPMGRLSYKYDKNIEAKARELQQELAAAKVAPVDTTLPPPTSPSPSFRH